MSWFKSLFEPVEIVLTENDIRWLLENPEKMGDWVVGMLVSL